MLVCWDWLEQYVELDIDHEALANMFAMSGLNHEGTEQVGSDLVIDLEVTSNRGDCLGHLGVAREASVLLKKPLKVPDPQPEATGSAASESISIENQFTDACPRYTARVIRGVKIGPSPAWLQRRLKAIGINAVNNVVDVTNYVMMECGQPLHAFDYAEIRGRKIIVRPAKAKEKFVAIDHHTYELDENMVVIADAERAVALGGVMGGAESEVSESTKDVLIESASFAPMAIRRAAHKLKLPSPSSYRFERRPDPAGLDWASRRCCELILQIAGGTLESGCVESGSGPLDREAIEFRLNQIPRVLGIEVGSSEVEEILTSLGCQVEHASAAETMRVVPPTWRDDLTREVDLIEEVARIHGYEKIPENVAVPLGIASPRPKDIVLTRVRHVLSAYGVDEAMTPSVVTDKLESCGSIWTDIAPLATETPLLVGSKLLRRSLLPSLLAARHTNQAQSIRNAQLYEVATAFVPHEEARGLPREQSTLGVVTTGELQFVKGLVEAILSEVVARDADLVWEAVDHSFFQPGTSLRITIDEKYLGMVGIVSRAIQQSLSLEQPCGAAELSVDLLTNALVEVRTADPISAFPPISRDLNFIVDEPLRWSELAEVCQASGGELLQQVAYQETYRDAKKDGEGKKRVLLTLHFRSLERTLTGDEVDNWVASVVKACEAKFAAKLLG